MLDRAAIVIPTFNEAENLERVVGLLRGLSARMLIIVVDDGSPDGTGPLAERLAERYAPMKVIHRKGKSGRGSACMAGFQDALARPDIDVVVEMDADMSHDPKELPDTVAALGGADMVIRSRYLPQSRIVNWSKRRLYFSKLANVFARWVLNVDISDLTNGYRAYRRKTAAAIELSQIRSSGYIVLSSVAYQLLRKGFRIVELPSVFVNRTRGQSNFSLREIEDAFLGILKLRFLS